MSFRTVVITQRCKLDLRMGYMEIRQLDGKKRIFLDEIGILILEKPAISLTGCLLSELMKKKIKVIFCDVKHNPQGELMPYYGCHDSPRKLRQQLSWKKETKNAVWLAILAEKIRQQALFLQELHKTREAELLFGYLDELVVRDEHNREGHAAKVYFNGIFGMDFTRDMDCSVNATLNYGYAILLLERWADLLVDFVGFDGHRKSLVTKILHVMERTAQEEAYLQETQQIMAGVEAYLDRLAYEQDLELSYEKLSLANLLKAVGIHVVMDYNSLVERLIAYMDLVIRFEGEKLFLLVNLRSFVQEDELKLFLETVIAHGWKVLLLDSHADTLLPLENRILIDRDLCEI